MRRPFVFLAILLCALTGLPAMPSGQSRPSVSGDLLMPGRPGDRIRIIVQAPQGTEASGLHGHLRGLLRRELKGAVALEVSRAELDLLSRDAALAHISADVPVAPDLAITNKRGLHARASAKFVQTVELYDAQIEVSKDSNTVGGTSIMGLMMLAASPGTTIRVIARGRQAVEAMTAIAELVAAKFHEE